MTALTGAASTGRRHATARPVTQYQVVCSEWIKLRTVRSSWFLLGATVASIAGVGLLVTYLTGAHWSAMSASSRAGFNLVNQSLIGVNLAELTIGVLGVLAVTGEYSSQQIRSTFAAVPRRFPVLLAKAAVLAVLTFVVSAASALIAVLGGMTLLASHGISLGGQEAAKAALGAALYLTVVAVIGVGLGFLIRSTAGGIGTLFALLLVLPILAAALPGSQSTAIDRYLPSTAGRALFITHSGSAMLSPWNGFGIFLLYAAAVGAAAALALRRRDA